MIPIQRIGWTAVSSTFLAALAAAQVNERVSISSSGAQGMGLSGYTFKGQALSSDGRYAVFASSAPNLVTADTNAALDVFLRDRVAGTTTRISVDSNGAQGNGGSGENGVSISADGRFVTFASMANNLVTGDSNGFLDIFVHDNQTGVTSRVSVDSAGSQANGSSYEPSLSADGHYVAFASDATNLVLPDTNGAVDVFVHDLQTGVTTRISNSYTGGQSDACVPAGCGSWVPVLSADGRYVAYDSYAVNIVPGDTNSNLDIFVYDTQAGLTTRASLGAGGAEPNDWVAVPAISGDGLWIAFNGMASNLVPNDTNAASDIFLYDMQNATLARISLDSGGAQADGGSWWPCTSADGRYVSFSSDATNLVPPDVNAFTDVFVRDTVLNTTTRMSLGYSGSPTNFQSDYAAISPDGLHVAFASRASNLVSNDTNNVWDSFVRDLDQPGESYCFGDGSGGACPCANFGLAGHGCDNSAATGGAQLASAGAPYLALDTLVLTSSGELPSAPSLFLQGDAEIAATNFGDGLRCVGGSLKRMYVRSASGGAVSVPQPGDLSISARSAALGDPLSAGMTRRYQAYYRDPQPSFCPGPTGDGWNVSSGISLVWLP